MKSGKGRDPDMFCEFHWGKMRKSAFGGYNSYRVRRVKAIWRIWRDCEVGAENPIEVGNHEF